ncbi:ribonuclease III [Prochlorococcus sp. AH-716-P08]|nr:ribonuclease III [Prochlorococcus sp. AH-716-P08]
MNYWIQNLVPYGSPEDIGVIQLAWLGDSVWELHQRLRHVHFPLKSKDLHLSVVNEVKAKSQSKSLSQIEHLLSSSEIDLIRRARNKTKRYPKSSDPSIYSRATGFETLIGWLFLKDPQSQINPFFHIIIIYIFISKLLARRILINHFI